MAVNPTHFGPGTLILTGADEAATTVDVSCQIAAFTVAWETEDADQVNVLCGDAYSGGTTYSSTASGTMVIDLSNPEDISYYTWTNKGAEVDFVFVPETSAGGQVEGTVKLVPLSIGSDEYGATLQAEFEWPCVGDPTLSPVVPPVDEGALV